MAVPARKPQDPFAPFTNPQISAQVKSIVGRLPAPITEQQIAQRAQATLDPVVQSVTNAINHRATAGAQAVGGYTDALARNLAGAQGAVTSAYAPAEAATAASSAALADRLSGAGNQTADALAARLASINQPGAVDPAVAAVRQTGAGSGNAVYGNGSASLQQLIGNAASAGEYAGKLPGIARLGGQQQIAGVQGRAQADTRDQTAQILSQLPGIVGQLRGMNDQRSTNRAQLSSDLTQFLLGQNTQKTIAKAGLAQDYAAVDAQNQRASAGEANQNARTAAQIDAANARAQTAATARTAAAKSAADAKVKAAQAAASAKARVAHTKSHQQAVKAADTLYYGVHPKQRYDTTSGKWMDVPGTGVPGVSYGDAAKKLRAQYPDLTNQEVVAILNDYYAPGERGRPAPKPTVSKADATTVVAPPTWVTP